MSYHRQPLPWSCAREMCCREVSLRPGCNLFQKLVCHTSAMCSMLELPQQTIVYSLSFHGRILIMKNPFRDVCANSTNQYLQTVRGTYLLKTSRLFNLWTACPWFTFFVILQRFHSITRQIFHKAQAFLLMYDITSSHSFSAVSYWASCIQVCCHHSTDFVCNDVFLLHMLKLQFF